MKKIVQISTFVYFLITITSIQAQTSVLSIEICKQKARDNYPLIKQYNILEQAKVYKLSNLMKGYLPQLTLKGSATYQSDVTNLPINLPNISSIDKNQYKTTVGISQILWDGGRTRSQQKITQAKNDFEKQNLEANLYTIQNQVNQLYFGILTIEEQLKTLDILKSDLLNSLNIAKAMLKNGTSLSSEVDAVKIEILVVEQKKIELNSLHLAYFKMLSAMIKEEINDKTILQKPTDTLINQHLPISRPEIKTFENQRLVLNAQENLLTAKNRPKIGFFLEGGYGRPGLNILSSEFDFFALGGIKISWNLGTLYTKGNEKKLIAVNKNKINIKEETFIFNTKIKLIQAYNKIIKAKKMIEKDNEIIKLRLRIKTVAEGKFKNGIYTVKDLLKDINAVNQSKQAKILHKMMYLMNIYNYRNIQGQFNIK